MWTLILKNVLADLTTLKSRIVRDASAQKANASSIRWLDVAEKTPMADRMDEVYYEAPVLQKGAAADPRSIELRIFFAVFAIFVLVALYFGVKAAVRTWRRRGADYTRALLAHGKREHMCKCASPPTMVIILPDPYNDDLSPGNAPPSPPPSPSSFLQTVSASLDALDGEVASLENETSETPSASATADGSEASSIDASSTNPLLELLSAPTASSVTVVAVAEINQSAIGLHIQAPVALISATDCSTGARSTRRVRHKHRHLQQQTSVSPHRHQHRKRERRSVGGLAGVTVRRHRSCSSASPPSPVDFVVVERQRPHHPRHPHHQPQQVMTHHHHHHHHHLISHQQPRVISRAQRKAKRRVSLGGAERTRSTTAIVGFARKTSTSSVGGAIDPLGTTSPERSRSEDDEPSQVTTIQIAACSVALPPPPPDYFDTMNEEWEKQGFCPLYKSRRTQKTETEPQATV